ncbi:MAG TPA: ribosome small subunit-dependent GTPase A [Spirochaetia bacterium]|nr:ribosome small subunit-dependent GTPase A [Spirochaetia bacterium]
MTLDGLITSMHGGFVFVRVDDRTVRCSARGRLKHRREGLLVGDRVVITPLTPATAVVESIGPRCSELLRPPVANADLAVLVQAAGEPAPSPALLDRMLIQAQVAGLAVLILWNKADLDRDLALELSHCYRSAGFTTWLTSTVTGEGVADLKHALAGRVSVIAGPSGAGKTSLLNAVTGGLTLKTQAVSARSQRGRHTTRLTELLPLEGGGMVADTPGFTSLQLPSLKKTGLREFYPEYGPLEPGCFFRGCLHDQEPVCAVKKALDEGKLDRGRYERYRMFLAELE